MDGIVVSLNAVEGQEATGSETLVVVADLNDIAVNAEVSSMDIGSVQQGQRATMTMYASDGSEISLTGEVQSAALEPTQSPGDGQHADLQGGHFGGSAGGTENLQRYVDRI